MFHQDVITVVIVIVIVRERIYMSACTPQEGNMRVAKRMKKDAPELKDRSACNSMVEIEEDRDADRLEIECCETWSALS